MHALLKTSLLAAALLAASIASGTAIAFAEDETVTPDSAANPDFTSAKALVDAGRYGEALPLLTALDKKTPDNPDVLNLIGFSLRMSGQQDQALDYYGRALKLAPEHLGANEYLGELYLQMKQPEKAAARLAVLQKACGDCAEYQELKEKITQATKAAAN
jgi:Flp pilus assembly protein TadD